MMIDCICAKERMEILSKANGNLGEEEEKSFFDMEQKIIKILSNVLDIETSLELWRHIPESDTEGENWENCNIYNFAAEFGFTEVEEFLTTNKVTREIFADCDEMQDDGSD